ncbi:MAG: tripartite tricarboxylate transporter substrate binding protein [Spirochaetes bacterium]|nr:tripartite tricarboxylate transporter substrate binding protein [Spirochaetota bacterium]
MKQTVKAVFLLGLVCLTTAFLFGGGAGEKAPKYPTKPIDMIAPAGAGGGWDLTIRTVAKVLTDTKLVPVPLPVTNKPGGGGGVNLAYMQTKKGADNLIAVYSPPLLLINLNGSSPYSYKNTTPLAALITDYGAFVVAKNSKYTSIAQVMEDLKKDPSSVVIGGTSAVGSMDHIQFLIMARAAGVKDLKKIKYVSFQEGSGPAQVLGGHIHLLSTGLSDVRGLLQSGDLRGLAQTGPERVTTDVLKDIPTCKEQGINEVFRNWRGLFGPPEMPEYAVNYWRKTLAEMVKTPEWDAACKQNGWTKNYMDAPDFMAFLDKTNEDYKAVLGEIGMLKQ